MELLVRNDFLKNKRSVGDKKIKFTFPKNRTEMHMRKENHLDSLTLATWYVTTSQLQFGRMFAKDERTFPHLWYMLCFLSVSLLWAKPQRIIYTSGKAMNILKNTAYLHSPEETAFLCENFLYEKLTQFDDVGISFKTSYNSFQLCWLELFLFTCLCQVMLLFFLFYLSLVYFVKVFLQHLQLLWATPFQNHQ